MQNLYKLPLLLAPQPEGGYTVTCPLLPELITEGGTVEEVVENVRDALNVVLEIYEDEGRSFPSSLKLESESSMIWFEHIIWN